MARGRSKGNKNKTEHPLLPKRENKFFVSGRVARWLNLRPFWPNLAVQETQWPQEKLIGRMAANPQKLAVFLLFRKVFFIFTQTRYLLKNNTII